MSFKWILGIIKFRDLVLVATSHNSRNPSLLEFVSLAMKEHVVSNEYVALLT